MPTVVGKEVGPTGYGLMGESPIPLLELWGIRSTIGDGNRIHMVCTTNSGAQIY